MYIGVHREGIRSEQSRYVVHSQDEESEKPRTRKKDGDNCDLSSARQREEKEKHPVRTRGRRRGCERIVGDGIVRSSRWERRARTVDRRCKKARASPVSAHGYRRWRAGVTWRDEGNGESEREGNMG